MRKMRNYGWKHNSHGEEHRRSEDDEGVAMTKSKWGKVIRQPKNIHEGYTFHKGKIKKESYVGFFFSKKAWRVRKMLLISSHIV